MSGATGEVLDSNFLSCSGSLEIGLEMCDIRMGNFRPNLDLRRSSFEVWYVGRTGDAWRWVEPLDRLKALALVSLGGTAPCIRTWRPVTPCFLSQKMYVYITVSEKP
jgi:hypothetical protein